MRRTTRRSPARKSSSIPGARDGRARCVATPRGSPRRVGDDEGAQVEDLSGSQRIETVPVPMTRSSRTSMRPASRANALNASASHDSSTDCSTGTSGASARADGPAYAPRRVRREVVRHVDTRPAMPWARYRRSGMPNLPPAIVDLTRPPQGCRSLASRRHRGSVDAVRDLLDAPACVVRGRIASHRSTTASNLLIVEPRSFMQSSSHELIAISAPLPPLLTSPLLQILSSLSRCSHHL